MTGNRYAFTPLQQLRQQQRGTFKRTRLSDGWETLDSFDALDIAMINDLTDAEFEREARCCIDQWNEAAPDTWHYEFISLA